MSDKKTALESLISKVGAFEQEAHLVLGRHEAAVSRAVLLERSYQDLTGLTLDQDALFREALRCVEQGLFRSAHVIAWAGFMDWLQHGLFDQHIAALKTARPKWKVNSIEDLQEQYSDYNQIDACAAVGMFRKAVRKALHGLLNKRNESAHPGSPTPELNETLGFVSELFNRINQIGA